MWRSKTLIKREDGVAVLNSGSNRAEFSGLIGGRKRYKTVCHHLFRDEVYIARSKVKFTAINGGVGE